MQIAGLQKMSLLDYPSKVSAIVFTKGCNMRCQYCQNYQLVDGQEEVMGEEEIFDYLEKRKNVLDGVVISGGEPLLQNNLEKFILKIKKMGLLVKLDTNGSLPERLKVLLDKKLLDYVAIDIKADVLNFEKVCEKNFYESLKKSLEYLNESGTNFEARTTVFQPVFNKTVIHGLKDLISRVPLYYLQNFNKSEHVPNQNLKSFSEEQMQGLLAAAKKHNPNTKIR